MVVSQKSEKTYRLLESSDLTKGDGAGSEAVRLLDTTAAGGMGGLAGLLAGQLLAWGLAASVLSRCLLGACHL